MKPLRIESLICRGYNGGLFTTFTPDDLRDVTFGRNEHKPTPAQYERPRTSEGVEYGTIADVVREARERVEAARKELDKVVRRAYEAGTPITPEQVRALGK